MLTVLGLRGQPEQGGSKPRRMQGRRLTIPSDKEQGVGKINVVDLKPGMVLAEDVICPANGRFLLPAGATLTDKNIRTIRSWGCLEAEVENSENGEAPAELSPEIIEEAQALTAPVFQFVDHEQEAIVELYRLSVLRTAHKLATGQRPPARPRPEEMESSASLPPDLFHRGEGGLGELLGGDVSLSSFPDIYFQIVEAIESPTSSARHLSELVSKDTSLTARLLRLVNSPLYGVTSRVDSVSRAIALIGTRELSTLALGISVIQVFKDVPPELADMAKFWRHSVAAGLFARLLAGQKPGLSGERFFVGGLLHDIGKLVFFKKLPHAATQTLRYSVANGLPVVDAEQEVMGFDHTELGRLLLQSWKIPPILVDMVSMHHEPIRAENPIEAAVIHLADIMCHAMGVSPAGPPIVPTIQESAWKSLALPSSVFSSMMPLFERQVHEIMSAFFGQGAGNGN